MTTPLKHAKRFVVKVGSSLVTNQGQGLDRAALARWAAQIAQLRSMLSDAKRPLVLLGGATWHASACADLQHFATANALPVACAFRFQDLLARKRDCS